MSRSLFRNTILYLPAQVLGPFVQFAVMIAWTHLLAPAAFGVVTFVIAAQELTALIGLVWWSLYVLRFRQRYEGEGDERFRAMDGSMALYGSATQIVFAPLCLLAVGAVADLATSLSAAAYLVTRLLVVHYSEWARSQHRISAYTAAQFSGPILGSGLSVLALIVVGATPAVVFCSMALGQAAGAAAVMGALGVRPRIGVFDRAIFREARRYGAPLILSGLFAWAAINGIRVLVEAGAGAVGLGLLSAGWGLGQRIANFIAMLCTAAAFPLAVDRIEAGDRKGALEQVSLNGTLMLALLTPATVGVSVLAAPLVDLLIAADYRAVTTVVFPSPPPLARSAPTRRTRPIRPACCSSARRRSPSPISPTPFSPCSARRSASPTAVSRARRSVASAEPRWPRSERSSIRSAGSTCRSISARPCGSASRSVACSPFWF
ncbi:MAG: lipopolysaccharide biosynthesis protein [Methylobacteriaceae bacterium]|nr:lipopolysaccharide biosynthesis protein [Methylobacteriaceae bacterium]